MFLSNIGVKPHFGVGSVRSSTAAIMSATSAQSAAVNDCPDGAAGPGHAETEERLADEVLTRLLERIRVVVEVGRRNLVDRLRAPVQMRGLDEAER